MHTKSILVLALSGVLGTAVTACDLDVGDLNNPGIDELESTPTAVNISAACTGLLVGNRRNVAAPNGYVSQLGILGREAYNFDTADPRYFGELLQGELNQGSPFGGNFWALPYGNLRLANVILHALDKVPADQLDDKAKSAIRGFAHTIQALDLLEVIDTHDTNGAVIDTDQPIAEPPAIQKLGAIVDRTATFNEIVRLLDSALPELDAGGDAFPFPLAEGYKGFDSPPTFRTFNRAIKARVSVYIGSYTKSAAAYQAALDALSMSFIVDDPAKLDLEAGVFHTFTTKSGDATNGLINPNIYAHPSVALDVQKTGATPDDRLTRKTALAAKPGAGNGVSGTLLFSGLYPRPDSPVPIIRNEELILLRAEALFFTGKVTEAVTELNLVRTKSGGLAQLVFTTPPSEQAFTDALLYERRYSLLFEGGFRWIDLRRFGRPLPLDPKPAGKDPDVANIRYPIPLPECNARPGEAACTKGST